MVAPIVISLAQLSERQKQQEVARYDRYDVDEENVGQDDGE
jgi:hypothetical protein